MPSNIKVDKNLNVRNTNPLKIYTSRQLLLFRSFRLLIHAEIEHFIEELGVGVVRKANQIWISNTKSTKTLLALLAFMDYKLDKNATSLNDRVEKAVTEYFNLISKNNGIKEDNVLKILLPLGLDKSLISQTWLSTMNSYGQNRGDVAHKSFKAMIPIDPVSEINNIRNILAEIKLLDENLRKVS